MSRCPNCAEVQDVNAHLRRRLAWAIEEKEKADADRLSMRESFQAFKDEYAKKEAELTASAKQKLDSARREVEKYEKAIGGSK